MLSVARPYEHRGVPIEEEGDDNDDICALLEELSAYQAQNEIDPGGDYEVNISSEDDIVEHFEKLSKPTDSKDIACGSCSKSVRVDDMSSIKRGHHISFAGRFGRKHLFGKQLHMYRHHAIVSGVKTNEQNCSKAEIELVHFWHDENGKLSIIKTSENLDLRKDEIYIIVYSQPKYDLEICARRAELKYEEVRFNTLDGNTEEQFVKYNVIGQNCEHFASWCVIGDDESFQVRSIPETIEKVLSAIFAKSCTLARFIKKITVMSSQDIADKLSKTMNIPLYALGIYGGVFFLYCIFMTLWFRSQRNSGVMCQNCFTRKWKELWLKFVLFIGISAGSLLIFHFAMSLFIPGVNIPIFVLLVLISVALQWTIVKLWKKLQSPFHCKKKVILKLENLNKGDIISMRFGSRAIDQLKEKTMIVSAVNLDDSSITGIFYARKRNSINSTVVEQTFTVNIKDNPIKLFDLNNTITYNTDEVLSRAKSRIGEVKWHMLSNRSEHLCFWAKVRQSIAVSGVSCDQEEIIDESDNTDSSLFVGEQDVHSLDEIEPGIALKVKSYFIFKRYCIVLRVCDIFSRRRSKLEVISFKNGLRRVQKEEIIIDLNVDRLGLLRYHPSHCHPKSKCVERAREILSNGTLFLTGYTFIEACLISKPSEFKRMETNYQILEGDVVQFKGKKTGIVVKIEKDANNEHAMGVDLVIYRFWRAITVHHSFDLLKDDIRFRRYSSNAYIDRNTIKERAVALTERKVFGRRWTTSGFIKECTAMTPGNEVSVLLFKDLQPGAVVVFKSLTGIVTGLLKEENNGKIMTMKRIVYDRGIGIVTIREDTVDLSVDKIYCIQYKAFETFSPIERMSRAKAIEGKTIPIHEWKDSDFINDCILLKCGPKRLVYSIGELQEGNVLEYPINGIITSIFKPPETQTQSHIVVVTCTNNEVRPEHVFVDLQKTNLVQCEYDSSVRCDRETSKVRAIAFVGKQDRGLIDKFIEQCIMHQNLKKYEPVDVDDIQLGDVIEMNERTLTGILVQKQIISREKKKMFVVCIVNGKNESFEIDLRHECISVRKHNKSQCHSKEHCMKRAIAMKEKGVCCKSQDEFVNKCIELSRKGTVEAYIYGDLKEGDIVSVEKTSGIVIRLNQGNGYKTQSLIWN